jgi:hypothetical protein
MENSVHDRGKMKTTAVRNREPGCARSWRRLGGLGGLGGTMPGYATFKPWVVCNTPVSEEGDWGGVTASSNLVFCKTGSASRFEGSQKASGTSGEWPHDSTG